jgi:FtsP/CotA-like multicopper oxidase with cupredoxin domain
LRPTSITNRRTFSFSASPDKTRFFIDEKVFDENRTDVTVKLGDTEEWTILNKHSQYHDFHIHQTGFLVAWTAVKQNICVFALHLQSFSPTSWRLTIRSVS